MPELHPGPDASLVQLEDQLRAIGLSYNAGYYLTNIGGTWCLAVSDDNYARWQGTQGTQGTQTPEPTKTEPSGDGGTDTIADKSTEDVSRPEASAQQKRPATKNKGR